MPGTEPPSPPRKRNYILLLCVDYHRMKPLSQKDLAALPEGFADCLTPAGGIHFPTLGEILNKPDIQKALGITSVEVVTLSGHHSPNMILIQTLEDTARLLKSSFRDHLLVEDQDALQE